MKHVILFWIGVFTCLIASAQNGKRGMAYGHHSPQDLSVLAPEVSWWYNWSEIPESSVAGVFGGYGFEFVPMTWNGNFDESKLRDYLNEHPETKYLLAFNEPNFLEQANMTPSEVAAQWPRLEALASEFNLQIVAPAVNFCGECVSENGTVYTDPFKYLDDFFAACPDCKVDHIAVHSYMNTVSALEWYIGEFKKYGKPIWLTEFAGWEYNGNINNVNDQISFMIGAVDLLENDPDVFRYAWFIGRGSGIETFPYIDLLGANGTLTQLGEVYKQMPTHDENHIVPVPATIEAEAYNSMSGILLERTEDHSGFANVGYIDAGDWLEYKIEVEEAGSYDIRLRAASTRNSSLQVLVDGEVKLTQSIPNTNGWQTWLTVNNTLELDAGVQTLRIKALTDGFNLNWMSIGDVSTALENFSDQKLEFKAFPNPGKGIVHLQTDMKISKLEVFNLMGTPLRSLEFARTIDLSELPSGMYILKAVDRKGTTLTTERIFIRR